MEGEDASTDAVTCLEHYDLQAVRCEHLCCGEAGNACAEDEYVGLQSVLRAFQHDSSIVADRPRRFENSVQSVSPGVMPSLRDAPEADPQPPPFTFALL